ncbi:MAG TPA: tRNA pseudouridine(55) synthase TruB [Anaerolineae bacterium]|nr:tRNA pseudouridine(55) synthase TruB [Anaerolineae bacterium]
MKEVNGILVVDKPSGWTSYDVVKKIKNLLGVSKVGHIGTLDPYATGVLVLLIGKATKSAKLFEHDKKKYLAEMTFGRATDTYDSTGKTTAIGDPYMVDMDKLKTIIRRFEGDSEQVPPMFSAIKIGGKKLYQLARAGKTISRNPRKITITMIESDLSDYPRITLNIECSKGTYIRSIAQQIGEMIGCPSHLSALRRTASGRFNITDSVDFLSLVESDHPDDIEHYVKPV